MHFHWHRLGTDDATAPPVVMLHGFLGNGRDWEEVARALRPGCRCLCPDLPGHGRTGVRNERDCTMSATAARLLEDLNRLAVNTCALAGYSMGGRLALYLAAKHPERFRCLALESASPGLRSEDERTHRKRHDENLAAVLETYDRDSDAFRDFLRRWYAQPIFLTLEQHPAALDALLQRRMENEPAALAASLRGMGTGVQPSLWDALPTLTLPTLLLAGAEDHKFCRLGEAMAEALPQAALETLQDCSHNLHFEQPKRYATILSAFFHAQNHL